MKIFLLGLPGSGKSTVGKKLAEYNKIPFMDLDEAIVESASQTIPEIFSEKGENYFRRLEHETLHHIMKEYRNLVLATGGGAPCFFDNLEAMNKNGITLYLKVSWATLEGRMQLQETEKRPLMAGLDHNNLVEELKGKFQYRLKHYKKAQYTIEEYIQDPAEIMNIIYPYST